MQAVRSIGFWRGFAAPFGALRQLASLPRAWPFVAVPALAFVAIEAAIVCASWRFLAPWLRHELLGGRTLRNLTASAASWFAVLVVAALGLLLAALLAPAISAPALERIVRLVEVDLRAPARAPLGFFAELGCGVRSLLLGSIITLPLVIALTLLEIVAPPLAVATTPLKLLLGALGVAWGLFDYPLTLRGVGARERFAFMGRHLSAVLGFGLAFSLVFWLPCFGIIMLPVGVAAVTRLYWEIERAQ
jgi:uncharacterized protein involved in cysteine biosynthesis